MKKIERSCPAKVNLLLKILGKRPDGYHELLTLMQAIDLADSIEVWRQSRGVALECDQPGIPTDGRNLMVKAAQLFLEKAEIREGVGMRLVKRVPVAAGLGGGSSDGAHTLSALNELFSLPLNRDELFQLSARLGSDVPFFLSGGAAVCRGRGEKVEPFAHDMDLHFVLVNPGLPLSTREVYESLKNGGETNLTGGEDLLTLIMTVLSEKNHAQLGAAISNDLEEAAIQKMPLLVQIKKSLLLAGGAGAMVSGSGPTVFALAQNKTKAEQVLEKARNLLGNKSFRFFVARAVKPEKEQPDGNFRS